MDGWCAASSYEYMLVYVCAHMYVLVLCGGMFQAYHVHRMYGHTFSKENVSTEQPVLRVRGEGEGRGR